MNLHYSIKFIIVALILYAVWSFITQSEAAANSQQTKQRTTTQVENNKVIISSVAAEKTTPSDNTQSNTIEPIEETDTHSAAPTSITANINFTWNGRKLRAITSDDHLADKERRKKISSPDAVWMGRKFIITATPQKIAEIIQKRTRAANTEMIDPNTNKSDSIPPIQPEIQTNNSGEPDNVLCPSVEMIKQTASGINDAYFAQNAYEVLSDEPVLQYAEVNWMVGIRSITAGSFDEAIYKAGIGIANTNQSKNEYAQMLDGAFTTDNGTFTLYLCSYGADDILAVGIWDKVPVEQ